jgi:MFS family permease
VAASSAVLLAAADTYVVVLALTDMMAGVGLGIESLQRATPIISGFLLGYIAVLPLIGRLADLLEHSRVLLGCLVVFVTGSVVTALAVELPVLVAGRFIQGVGGGGLVPATLAIVAALWPAERRGTPLGVVGAVQELGAVLGPVLGAVILAVSGWRAIFWFNAAVGVVLYAVVRALSRRSPAAGSRTARGGRDARVAGAARTARVALVAAALGVLTLWAPERLVTDVTLGIPFVPFVGQSRVLTPIGVATLLLLVALAGVTARRWAPTLLRADLLGAVLVAVALGSLVLAFSSADPEKEVVGPLGHVLLPVGALALLLAAWRHRTAANPLVRRGVLRGRGGVAVVVSLLAGAALVSVIVDVPILARLTLTDSQTTAALVLVRFLVAVPVGALLGGWALRALGDGVVAAVGLAIAGGGLLVMAGWDHGSLASSGSATLVLAAVGLGLGLSLAPVNAAALADSPDDAHGVAGALVVVARMVGMVTGLALLTAVGLHRYYRAVARLPDQGDARALLDAALVQVQTVFLGAAVAALLGAAASLAMGLRRRGGPGAVQAPGAGKLDTEGGSSSFRSRVTPSGGHRHGS